MCSNFAHSLSLSSLSLSTPCYCGQSASPPPQILTRFLPIVTLIMKTKGVDYAKANEKCLI